MQPDFQGVALIGVYGALLGITVQWILHLANPNLMHRVKKKMPKGIFFFYAQALCIRI